MEVTQSGKFLISVLSIISLSILFNFNVISSFGVVLFKFFHGIGGLHRNLLDATVQSSEISHRTGVILHPNKHFSHRKFAITKCLKILISCVKSKPSLDYTMRIFLNPLV